MKFFIKRIWKIILMYFLIIFCILFLIINFHNFWNPLFKYENVLNFYNSFVLSFKFDISGVIKKLIKLINLDYFRNILWSFDNVGSGKNFELNHLIIVNNWQKHFISRSLVTKCYYLLYYFQEKNSTSRVLSESQKTDTAQKKALDLKFINSSTLLEELLIIANV